MALEAMDILAGWGESSILQTERMIGLASAVTLFKSGRREVSITTGDMDELLKQFYPQTSYDAVTKTITVKLIPITEKATEVTSD